MISKIIQKEKDRQEVIINHDPNINRFLQRKTHKQSLINLKEHFESHDHNKHHNDCKEDIKALEEMIGRYE